MVNILERREYTGCTVNFKTYTNSIWDKKQRDNPLEKQAIFPNTHEAIIEEAGGTLDAVVHCRAFLSDMKHFPEFESVYRSYFSAPYPARMTVASAGIYDGLDVEMDAIAYLP